MELTNADIVGHLNSMFADSTKEYSGAELGASLKVRFPGLSPRDRFGSLTEMVRQLMDGGVRQVGKKGMDVVFSRGTKTELPPSPWVVFHNPNSRGSLWLNPTNGQWIVEQSPAAPGEDYVEVKRMLPEAQRNMMARFVDNHPEHESASKLKEALDDPTAGYWAKFGRAVVPLQKEWLVFRSNFIVELLAKAIADAASLDMSSARDLAIALRQDHPAAPVQVTPARSLQPLSTRPAQLSLADVAKQLVGFMSASELGEIKVSLATVQKFLSTQTRI
jgi:hypothetical protein